MQTETAYRARKLSGLSRNGPQLRSPNVIALNFAVGTLFYKLNITLKFQAFNLKCRFMDV